MRKTHNIYTVEDGIGILKVMQGTQVKSTVRFDPEDLGKIQTYHWNSYKNYCVSYPTWKGKAVFMHRLVMNTPDELEVDHINHDHADNRKSNLRNVTKAVNARNRKDAKNIRVSVLQDGRKVFRVYFKVNDKFLHFGHYATMDEATQRRDEIKARLIAGEPVEPTRGTNEFKPMSESGERYIGFHKATGKWAVTMRLNGKQKHFGLFPTIAEAVKARDAALHTKAA